MTCVRKLFSRRNPTGSRDARKFLSPQSFVVSRDTSVFWPLLMKQLIARFTILLLILTTAYAQQVFGQCKVGKDAPPYGFWSWAPQSRIKVYILSADFRDSDLAFLLKPIQNWNAVMEQTGSGVRFEYVGPTSAPLYCENCLTILRGEVYDNVKRHATELKTYSAHHDRIMSWAHIVVDPKVTNKEALTNAIAHELGHNLGLLDCYSCKPKSTVMNKFKTINVPNEMDAPTACDVAQVRTGYSEVRSSLKKVAVRGKQSAKQSEVEDGEEPVDDDTPIVIRKP